ncbi:Tim44 domain-containing protein [Altererythrobacter sp. FM1]|uniref:Tim44 domain-containing protein n=1 Tax=Tsuneonella flava TaxID=2055955 RepID=A0ABX7K9F1_9SPHN|nr:Tim44/TimA family putative adaptor protein [Tsuneonella flava]QSB44614.1 Tim44 domain-containing protein [Tsuneonella flava]ROT94277.1 Tim44 domain-containing protein [Altererythrobacter sp. FM1]UBS33049.1 Tim44/TimA family putative adaptor protein [Altererythrobacter sp. N1]
MILQIVILAMIAAFLGLRLYSVLGRRAEHEEESIPNRFDSSDSAHPTTLAPAQRPVQQLRPAALEGAPMAVERGVQAIAGADRNFDITGFLEGAKGAYAMILEAFWQGDRDTLKELTDSDVYAGFDAAITAREQAGETLENRLVRIEDAKIDMAELVGQTARIRVAFCADIAAVTRDKDGNVVAGSLDDAIEARDLWTFRRDVRDSSPQWVLDETDEA